MENGGAKLDKRQLWVVRQEPKVEIDPNCLSKEIVHIDQYDKTKSDREDDKGSIRVVLEAKTW